MLIKLFTNYFVSFFWIVASFLLLAIPLVWIQFHDPHRLLLLNGILSHYVLFFTLFRWSLIMLIVLLWPIFIQHYGLKKHWKYEETQFWLMQRFRIAGWLVVFELLVCENLFLTLIKTL
jgi:hypothetical protein